MRFLVAEMLLLIVVAFALGLAVGALLGRAQRRPGAARAQLYPGFDESIPCIGGCDDGHVGTADVVRVAPLGVGALDLGIPYRVEVEATVAGRQQVERIRIDGI